MPHASYAHESLELSSRRVESSPESSFEEQLLRRDRSEVIPRAHVGDDDITPFVLHDTDLVDDLEDLVAFDSLDYDTDTDTDAEYDPDLTRQTSLEALARTTAASGASDDRDGGDGGDNTVATSPTTIGDPRVTAMRELYLRGDTENALSLAEEISSMIPPAMAAQTTRVPEGDDDVASEASFGILPESIRPRTPPR
ncbi:hypothetical protein AKJ09_03579 [Labilithrix luteola]|uniref:Uncharacterized protein n=2 Tax=Labilithrix luteola TaxID=1391654 RepID=A0A0K1PTQ5_9BACT|nr:hypothetical protein AKJ09_03579 [Labilithrix luteola]